MIDNPSYVYATKRGTLNICEVENCCKDFELHSPDCFLRLDYAQRSNLLANNSYLLDAALNYSCVHKNASSSLALFEKLVAKIALVSKCPIHQARKTIQFVSRKPYMGILLCAFSNWMSLLGFCLHNSFPQEEVWLSFSVFHVGNAPSGKVHH